MVVVENMRSADSVAAKESNGVADECVTVETVEETENRHRVDHPRRRGTRRHGHGGGSGKRERGERTQKEEEEEREERGGRERRKETKRRGRRRRMMARLYIFSMVFYIFFG